MTLKDKESSVLVLGCGNSLLSEKMHLKMGLTKITSIDFEESVIKKMIHREKPIEYQVMDMLHMTFADGSWDYALDKGSLDALCADATPETASKVVQYFNEVIRVLNPKGGTYICVSLLQDFVLDALISFFGKGVGNKHFEGNLIDFRIQKLDKRWKKGEDKDASNFLPFFVTIKRT
jgi:ubiquinone/menaquinone biosynthesis C-methylase UbiE